MLKINLKKKEKKKDKPKKKFTGKGLKIVDEDSFTNPYNEQVAEESEPEEADELPQVADVVDERPAEVQFLESLSKGKWKRLDDDSNKAVDESAKGTRISKSPSPPRRRKAGSVDISPPRQRRRHDSDDVSPPRQRKRKNSDDASPPRQKKRKNSISPSSPPRQRRRRHSSDDVSPPRQRQRKRDSSNDRSPPRQRNRSKDISPPRRHQSRRDSPPKSPPRRRRNSRDFSPPRRDQRRRDSPPARRGRDSFPPQRRRRDSDDASPPRQRQRKRDSDDDLSPLRIRREGPQQSSRNYGSGGRRERDRNVARPEVLEDASDEDSKSKTTLDGKKAGLQRGTDLKNEMVEFRKRENEMYEMLPDEVSGRHAKAVVRDRRTEEDIAKEREKERKEAERKEKYSRWGKGLKQVEEQQERVRSALHEMSKPLARLKNDEDLDDHLKSIDREGDPMLEYLNSKRKKASGVPDKPMYKGPPPPPNRFHIPPGFRWDGVDRSNGYEKEWFGQINAKKAIEEDAYKWSVEDL